MEAIEVAAPVEPRALHLLLARFNQRRLRPSLPRASWREELREEAMMRELEGDFVESERAAVAERARTAPSEADAFVRWFEELRETGPGQGDPLFPWLQAHASLAEMRWFLDQEVAGEAGFDDLVALAQVKMPVQAKLELARNYWDEMGRGASGPCGPLLGTSPTCWASTAIRRRWCGKRTRSRTSSSRSPRIAGTRTTRSAPSAPSR
jgi:hypothetical protein